MISIFNIREAYRKVTKATREAIPQAILEEMGLGGREAASRPLVLEPMFSPQRVLGNIFKMDPVTGFFLSSDTDTVDDGIVVYQGRGECLAFLPVIEGKEDHSLVLVPVECLDRFELKDPKTHPALVVEEASEDGQQHRLLGGIPATQCRANAS